MAEKEEKEDKELSKKGLVESHKENLSEKNKEDFAKTNAGPQPIMDKEGHLSKAVDEKIVGSEITKEIVGASSSASSLAYKCYVHGGNNMPMYTEAGCKAAGGANANFAGVQAKYDKTYGECLKKSGGSFTWDNRKICV